GTARLWGLAALRHGKDEEVLGDHLPDLTITIGTASVLAALAPPGGSGLILPCPLAAPTKWADAIALGDDKSLTPPGARVYGNADNASAVVLIDGTGYSHYVIELKKGTCRGIGGMYRFI